VYERRSRRKGEERGEENGGRTEKELQGES
jgi:hypothetical protein